MPNIQQFTVDPLPVPLVINLLYKSGQPVGIVLILSIYAK
jgi:hypothetical protein